MGNLCGTGAKPLEVEADICYLFSQHYREEGLRVQRQNASQCPPRLTDSDWATVMEKGPAQWRMTVPPEAVLEPTAEEEVKPPPVQGRRRWSSVIGLVSEAVKAKDMDSSPSPRNRAAVQGPSSAARGEKLCEVEVLQEGCCTIRFDTMKHLIDQMAENKTLTENTRLSPALPVAETKQGEGRGQAIFIEATPIVLQSTLPLPQQAEVYYEIELLSFVPFKCYVAIGVATAPYPVHHFPGLLPGSCALLSTGQVYTGRSEWAADGQVLMEGDVIGCLLCRKSGQILFFLNGEPTWQVHCPEIALQESTAHLSPRGDGQKDRDIDSDGGREGERRRRGSVACSANAAAQDMYVTIGVLGKGELEINFGGKSFNLSGEITKVSKGAVQSTAPIAARAFGYRLARFHIMLDELKLFYSCFNPPMVSKAKGMVVLNISRAEDFNAELKDAYGKDLTDVSQHAREINKRKLANFFRQQDPRRLSQVDRIFDDFGGDSRRLNEFLRKTYGCDMTNSSVRRKQSVEAMLLDYFTLIKRRQDSIKLEAVAEQALVKPAMVDSFLRERYKVGINVLLKNRLRQVYMLYAPESIREVDHVAEKYPLFDDAYMLNTKMRVRYGVDLDAFSPIEPKGEDGQQAQMGVSGALDPASASPFEGGHRGPLELLETEGDAGDMPSLSIPKGRQGRSLTRSSHSGTQQKRQQRSSRFSSRLSLSFTEPSEANLSSKKQQTKATGSFRSRSRLSTQEEDSLGYLPGEAIPGASGAPETTIRLASLTVRQQAEGSPSTGAESSAGRQALEEDEKRQGEAEGELQTDTEERKQAEETEAGARRTAENTNQKQQQYTRSISGDEPAECGDPSPLGTPTAEAEAADPETPPSKKHASIMNVIAEQTANPEALSASPTECREQASEEEPTAAAEEAPGDETEAAQTAQLLVYSVLRRSSATAAEKRDKLAVAIAPLETNAPTQQQNQGDGTAAPSETDGPAQQQKQTEEGETHNADEGKRDTRTEEEAGKGDEGSQLEQHIQNEEDTGKTKDCPPSEPEPHEEDISPHEGQDKPEEEACHRQQQSAVTEATSNVQEGTEQ